MEERDDRSVVAAITRSGTVLEWSSSCSDLTGVPRHAARGAPVEAALALEGAAVLRAALERVADGGGPLRIATRVARAGGAAIALSWWLAGVAPRGAPAEAVLMTAAPLGRLWARPTFDTVDVRHACLASPFPMLTIDRATLALVDANPAAAARFGLEDGALGRTALPQLFAAEDSVTLACALATSEEPESATAALHVVGDRGPPVELIFAPCDEARGRALVALAAPLAAAADVWRPRPRRDERDASPPRA